MVRWSTARSCGCSRASKCLNSFIYVCLFDVFVCLFVFVLFLFSVVEVFWSKFEDPQNSMNNSPKALKRNWEWGFDHSRVPLDHSVRDTKVRLIRTAQKPLKQQVAWLESWKTHGNHNCLVNQQKETPLENGCSAVVAAIQPTLLRRLVITCPCVFFCTTHTWQVPQLSTCRHDFFHKKNDCNGTVHPFFVC